jgi:DNA-binding PadR family transcriptional regulator
MRTSPGDLSALDQQVMLAMLRLHPSPYGVTIREHIADKTGKTYSLGSIYAVLDRLQERGYATSRLGEPTAERGGRAKLYFTLTASGEATLRRSLEALRSLQTGIRWKEALRTLRACIVWTGARA